MKREKNGRAARAILAGLAAACLAGGGFAQSVVNARIDQGPRDGQAFKAPKTDAEWIEFCKAPDMTQRLMALRDVEYRQEIGSTCVRAPWRKFKPSPAKAW